MRGRAEYRTHPTGGPDPAETSWKCDSTQTVSDGRMLAGRSRCLQTSTTTTPRAAGFFDKPQLFLRLLRYGPAEPDADGALHAGETTPY